MKIDMRLKAGRLEPLLERFFELAKGKVRALNKAWDPRRGSPVFTVRGRYTTRGWTEWTQGFQFGCQLLVFDATGDESFLRMGRENTLRYMPVHVSHTGVHDHGFNIISTYGNLRRLALEERYRESEDAVAGYELALKVSGAVQAARWTTLNDGTGFIYSFNGPHSLFADTIRTCRGLILAHQLGHCLMGENDRRISLLDRAVEHAANTAKYNVFYGKTRDRYDVWGRVAQESIFNVKDGSYRCPATQQGYSPFSTWTRGLAWAMLGFAEFLECLRVLCDADLEPYGGRKGVKRWMLRAARATCDFYIANTPLDGIPYWDTAAPGLARMPGHLDEPAKPDNPYEPVDSSAAVIAAQGLLRLGAVLGVTRAGKKYWQAGLTIARTVFAPPYLCEHPRHQGLLLHSVYHQPKAWDYVPPTTKAPHGESSMWGDYHALELALYLRRYLRGGPYPAFFDAR